MTDLLDRLKTALADRYRIEQEHIGLVRGHARTDVSAALLTVIVPTPMVALDCAVAAVRRLSTAS